MEATDRIRQSFDRQGFMRTLGASLESVESGTVTIGCAFDERMTQNSMAMHGGIAASLADVACGYAALTMIPEGREVLTVEFKINFLKPAKSACVIAVGKVCSQGEP